MRITYLMINADIVCGGNRTVFGQVNGLIERGHDVKLLALAGDKPFIPLKTAVINVPRFDGMIPPSDIVVATFNIRALPRYNPNDEIPFYMTLINESYYWDDPIHREICNLLYRSPMNLLVNSTWTMEIFRKELHRQSYRIPDGIDLDFFKSRKDKILCAKNRKVLIMYRGGINKGLSYGLEALGLIKKRSSDIEIVLFGTDELPKVDFPYTFFFNPPQEDLVRIYSSCDAFIIPSLLEGSPNPPKEAMACGCAVVSTDWPGHQDICVDQETALVVPRRDPKRLAEAAIKILEDDLLRSRLIEGGYKKVKEFEWRRVIGELEEVFERVKELKSQRDLREMTEWEKVVAISPEDAWAHYQFGIELSKMGRMKEVEREFEEAARCDPSFELPLESLRILRGGQRVFPQDWSDLKGSLLIAKGEDCL